MGSQRYLVHGVPAMAIAIVVSSPAYAEAAAPAAQASSTAPAQPAKPNDGVEDIIVTARRHSESLMNVPMQVNAISAATLEREGTSQLSDITKIAPQVVLSKGISGTGATFNIRGIGSEFSDPGLDQSVLVNLDGAQINRGRVVAGAMFDLAQVEVLKGPQALSFGKNATGGVVTLTSANPTDHLEVSGKAGYEFDAQERYFDAAISGPIADGLTARIAGHFDQMRGYIRDVAVARPNVFSPAFPLPGAANQWGPGTEDAAGRISIRYAPAPNFDALVKVSYSHSHSDNSTGGIEPICGPGVVSATLGVPDPTGHCGITLQNSNSALPVGYTVNWPKSNGGVPYGNTNVVVATAQLHYQPSHWLDLTSITSYYNIVFNGLDDITGTSFAELYYQSSEMTHDFEQELRATTEFNSRLNFTFGSYFEDSHRSLPQATMLTTLFAPDPTTGRYYSYSNSGIVNGKAYSLSGQFRWDFIDNFELNAGVRWTHEDKFATISNPYVNPNWQFAVPLPEGDVLSGPFHASNWSPEATVSWHPNPNSLLYAAFKTGYKSGGFSTPGLITANYTIDTLRYGNEKASGFEIGYKTEMFDRRLRVTLTAYDYAYTNLQLTSVDPHLFTYTIKNAGEARVKGIEAEAAWRITPQLTFNGSFGYNHARYVYFPNGQCTQQQEADGCVLQDLSGRPLVRAPALTLNLEGVYEQPISEKYKLGFNLSGRYTSSYYTEETLSDIPKQQGFWLLNAGVHFGPRDGTWDLALLGRNLTNKIYISSSLLQALGNTNSYVAVPERPREVAVQGSFKF